EDQAWMESSSDSDQEINANMVFMDQIKKVLSDSEASSSSADDKISKVSYYLSEFESEYEYETLEYYDNTTTYGLFVDDNDYQEIFHDYENFPENLIESPIDHNELAIDHNDSGGDKHVRDLKYTVLERDFKISELKECVRNKDLEIEKCLERLNVCENKLHKMGQTNQTVHMIMPSKDTLYNGRKGIGFENPSYFEKAKDLRPSLYDEKVIGLGYTSMFLTHYDEALEIEKFIRARENKIKFAYDYGNCSDLSLDHRFGMFKAYDGTPQQNGVVERRNRTLVEAARTMLTFAILPSFLWAEAIATACFTQNCSIIHNCFDKTPYELINKRKPNIKFFRVFEGRCYLLNDYEDVGKLKAKGDIGVFAGYSKESAAFTIYNKRTCKIYESVNVNFDEILEMSSKQFSLEPGLSNLNE
nr:retrovirus-related Pol polyprotein from transposon TNT 1-94 [Tanacetum cinerariifolium]